jgi:hypothetical protein
MFSRKVCYTAALPPTVQLIPFDALNVPNTLDATLRPQRSINVCYLKISKIDEFVVSGLPFEFGDVFFRL